jgi:anti-anti-sigma factor
VRLVEGADVQRRVTDVADQWQVDVTGELDLATSRRLDDVIDQVCDQGGRSVLLDLSRVSFLDSSGLRSVVRGRARMEAAGGTLSCVGLSAAAERVLELTGVLERLRDGSVSDPG